MFRTHPTLAWLALLSHELHSCPAPHCPQASNTQGPYDGQHSLGCNTCSNHGSDPGTDDGTRVHTLAVVVAGGDFTTVINALVDIESNALLTPHSTLVPFLVCLRVHIIEVALSAKLCPEVYIGCYEFILSISPTSKPPC